jgi:hypothetical protein
MKFFKIAITTINLMFAVNGAYADQYVHGYTRSNGTYVQGYMRSSPNGTVQDNFSYKGNIDPYTGNVGTNYYRHNSTSQYFDGCTFNCD